MISIKCLLGFALLLNSKIHNHPLLSFSFYFVFQKENKNCFAPFSYLCFSIGRAVKPSLVPLSSREGDIESVCVTKQRRIPRNPRKYQMPNGGAVNSIVRETKGTITTN